MGLPRLPKKRQKETVDIVKHCQRPKKSHKDNFFDGKVLVSRLRADHFQSFRPYGLKHIILTVYFNNKIKSLTQLVSTYSAQMVQIGLSSLIFFTGKNLFHRTINHKFSLAVVRALTLVFTWQHHDGFFNVFQPFLLEVDYSGHYNALFFHLRTDQ